MNFVDHFILVYYISDIYTIVNKICTSSPYSMFLLMSTIKPKNNVGIIDNDAACESQIGIANSWKILGRNNR